MTQEKNYNFFRELGIRLKYEGFQTQIQENNLLAVARAGKQLCVVDDNAGIRFHPEDLDEGEEELVRSRVKDAAVTTKEYLNLMESAPTMSTGNEIDHYHMENTGEGWGDVSVIDVDQLEMVYPLTPGIQIAYLSLNAAQTCLYLHTVEDGTYTITVIDLSTMEPKQMLDVMHFEDEPSWGISDQDDFMVIDFYHTMELAVVSKDESGALTLEYICPLQPEGVNFFNSYRTAMDFDGERLVLAQLLDIEFSHEPDYRDRTSCGIQVSVYEKDGMTFFGEYRSSLDTGEDWTDHAFYVHGVSREPVIATWTR